MGEKRPLLSFCMPSYNRAERAVAVVRDILEGGGDEVEVIVTDDVSTDDTVARLSEIKDPRLRVIVNQENLGACGNMVESLRYCRGKYCFVILNRGDYIIKEKIPELIGFLRGGVEYSVLYCGSNRGYGDEEKDHQILKAGEEAGLFFAYALRHPGNYMYRVDELNTILERISSKSAKDRFMYQPNDFIGTEMALTGKFDTCLYNKYITVSTKNAIRSGRLKDYGGHMDFVEPDKCVKRFDLSMWHLKEISIRDEIKRRIAMKAYGYCLGNATVSCRKQHLDKEWCDHFGGEVKDIHFLELLRYGDWVGRSCYKVIAKRKIKIRFCDKVRIRFSVLETFFRLLKNPQPSLPI